MFFCKDSYFGKDIILVTQEVIETKPLLTGLVKAEKISNSLKTKGHIAIYGIYFDTGKYNIKTESKAALREIALFLKKYRKNKYYIVGHTDNVGNFAANMTLSKNRAKAVMNYLVKKLGVKAKQLKASGVASLSPVTSNSTDAGKARNRRVEIVEQ